MYVLFKLGMRTIVLVYKLYTICSSYNYTIDLYVIYYILYTID